LITGSRIENKSEMVITPLDGGTAKLSVA